MLWSSMSSQVEIEINVVVAKNDVFFLGVVTYQTFYQQTNKKTLNNEAEFLLLFFVQKLRKKKV